MDEERVEMFNIMLVLIETIDHPRQAMIQMFLIDLMMKELNDELKYVTAQDEFFKIYNQAHEVSEIVILKTLPDGKHTAWDFIAMPNGMVAYKLSNTGKIEQTYPKNLYQKIYIQRHQKYKRDGEVG